MTDEAEDDLAALGLAGPLAAVSAEDVRSAFRRAALSVHPDKSDGGGGEGFSRLVAARDRVLSRCGSVADADADADARVAWAVWIACVVLGCTVARSVDISVDATLGDLYEARVKRVVISVIRVPHHFRRTRQALLVRLALPSKGATVGSMPIVFDGLGDDPPADVLLGRSRRSRRGQVRVHVRLVLDPHGSLQPDTVICPCDLHATAGVSVFGRYFGETVRVELPGDGGDVVEAQFSPEEADAAAETEPTRSCRQTRVFAGRGLPYLSGEPGAEVAGRGDLYVFMDVRLPTLGKDWLADPWVKGALGRLFRGSALYSRHS